MSSRTESRAPSPQKRHAFTLIELLVTIAIIGILASMLSVGLAQAKKKANATHCAGNLKQLLVGARMFADDNKERFPKIDSGNGDTNRVDNVGDALRSTLAGYVDSEESFLCRGDRRSENERASGSYAWNSFWNGKLIDSLQGDRYSKRLIEDKEAWHGFKNAVYLDGRVERDKSAASAD